MRRKGLAIGPLAVSGNIDVTLAGACLFLATLVWLSFAGQRAQEPARKMTACSDGGACLSELSYVPGERPTVSVARLEVR